MSWCESIEQVLQISIAAGMNSFENIHRRVFHIFMLFIFACPWCTKAFLDHVQSVNQPPLMEGGLNQFCINPEKHQTELDCLIRLYWLLEVVFLFCSIFFSTQVISPCLFVSSYLSRPTAAGSFYLGRLMLLTVLSILAVQPRPHWLGSQIFIGSDCGLPLSFRSSIILSTNAASFPGGSASL